MDVIRESNAHIPIGVYLNCEGDAAIETRLENIIDTFFLLYLLFLQVKRQLFY